MPHFDKFHYIRLKADYNIQNITTAIRNSYFGKLSYVFVQWSSILHGGDRLIAFCQVECLMTTVALLFISKFYRTLRNSWECAYI